MLAISVTQLKYRFNANAGVTNVLAVISANAAIIAIMLRNVLSVVYFLDFVATNLLSLPPCYEAPITLSYEYS